VVGVCGAKPRKPQPPPPDTRRHSERSEAESRNLTIEGAVLGLRCLDKLDMTWGVVATTVASRKEGKTGLAPPVATPNLGAAALATAVATPKSGNVGLATVVEANILVVI
jgi:hypothetical protein